MIFRFFFSKMPDCCVVDCNFKKSPKGTYQSFYFPKDPEMRRKWLNQVQREKKSFIVNDKSAVCTRHFKEDDFEPVVKNKKGYTPKTKTLKPKAVPSLLMVPQSQQKVVDPRETRKSVQSLQGEKNKLEIEMKRLQKENQLQKETIESKDREIQELKESLKKKGSKDEDKLREVQASLSELTDNLKNMFTDDQIWRMKNPLKKIGKWSDATLRTCIVIYLICGKAAYQYLLHKKWPLVPIPTLHEHMRKVNFDPGILDDIFILMSYKLEDVPPQHRNFGIVMDEMSIQPKLDFDINNQAFIGKPTAPINPKTIEKRKAKDPNFDETKCLATHAMNFLLCGMAKRIKQIVAWFLTYSSFDPLFIAAVLKKIVVKSHEISARIVAITIDMSGQNQKI